MRLSHGGCPEKTNHDNTLSLSPDAGTIERNPHVATCGFSYPETITELYSQAPQLIVILGAASTGLLANVPLPFVTVTTTGTVPATANDAGNVMVMKS